MNWNRISLFKMPNSHKRFGYVPRYYDPEKEELKKKLKAANVEEGNEDGGKRAREISFKAKTADRWNNSDYKSQSMRSNLRLVLILAGIIILFYFVFQALDGMGLFIDENLRQ